MNLKGAALNWVHANKVSNGPIADWPEFKMRITQAYAPPLENVTDVNKLMSVRQISSVDQYITNFRMIAA